MGWPKRFSLSSLSGSCCASLISSALLVKEKARLTGGVKDHQLVVFFRDFLKVIIGIIGC